MKTAFVTAVRYCIVAVCCCPLGIASAKDWPQFRGPDGQGRSAATELPISWSESENVRWKTAVPGEGHSSPVIAGDEIWITSAIGESLSEEEQKTRLADIKNSNGLKLVGDLSLQALQFDANSGRLIKQVTLFEIPEPEPKHSLNSYASPTPVIADGSVYCHFGTYGTACIDRESGEVLWRVTDIHVDHQNGPGSSPVVWNDLLIVHFDGTDAQFLTAFDRATGKVRWQTNRSGVMDPTPELQKAYGTPLIVQSGDKSIVVSPAANWVYGYDAETGEEIWKANYGKLGFSTVPRPVADHDTVYVSTSYMQPRLLAVRFDGHGDVTETHVKWISDKLAPKKPSMLISNGLLYSVSDNGIAACMNAADGTEIWKTRLTGDFSASPLIADGMLYFFGQNGTTTVLQEGDELKEVSRNTFDDGFMASPAVIGKALILRTEKWLYRIERP